MPVEGLPKALEILLGTFVGEFDLKSWQIFSDKDGANLRIRFRNKEHGGASTGVSLSLAGSYTKKSPSQMQRDHKRSVEHSQQKRITTRSVSAKLNSNQIPRSEQHNTSKADFVSPISVHSNCVERTTPSSIGNDSDISVLHAGQHNSFNSGVIETPLNCDSVISNQLSSAEPCLPPPDFNSVNIDHSPECKQTASVSDHNSESGSEYQEITDDDGLVCENKYCENCKLIC